MPHAISPGPSSIHISIGWEDVLLSFMRRPVDRHRLTWRNGCIWLDRFLAPFSFSQAQGVATTRAGKIKRSNKLLERTHGPTPPWNELRGRVDIPPPSGLFVLPYSPRRSPDGSIWTCRCHTRQQTVKVNDGTLAICQYSTVKMTDVHCQGSGDVRRTAPARSQLTDKEEGS